MIQGVSLSHFRSPVWKKTDGHCHYCRKKLDPFTNFHMDHVIPRSRGGMDIIENLVPACSECNLSKVKLVEEWEGPRI